MRLIKNSKLPADRKSPAYNVALRQLHAAILGVCALVDSYPYTIERWMPELLTNVLAEHTYDPVRFVPSFARARTRAGAGAWAFMGAQWSDCVVRSDRSRSRRRCASARARSGRRTRTHGTRTRRSSPRTSSRRCPRSCPARRTVRPDPLSSPLSHLATPYSVRAPSTNRVWVFVSSFQTHEGGRRLAEARTNVRIKEG